jgi:ABC-type multidrug transport system fused ATPase/permease subunit
MLVAAVFEILAIAIILPMISLLTSPIDQGRDLDVLGALSFASFPREFSNFNIVLLVLVIFSFSKMLFSAFLIRSQIHFSSQLELHLATALHKSYFRRPYVYHLKNNSASMVNSLQSEIELTQRSFVSLFTAVTELFVAISICAILVLYSFGSTVIAGTVFLTAILLYELLVQKKIVALGKDLSQESPKLLQILIQGFQGIKEIKIYKQEEKFFETFSTSHSRALKTRIRYQWFSRFPAMWYEFFSIFALSSALFVLNQGSLDDQQIIQNIGLLVFGCFRLVPALNRVTIGLNDLRFSGPAIASVRDQISIENSPLPSGVPVYFNHTITLDNVSFRYRDDQGYILRNASLTINKGDFVQIIGASGVGKSTVVDILMGLLPLDSGFLVVDGIPVKENETILAMRVAYVPQSIYLIDDTVKANIEFGSDAGLIDSDLLDVVLRASQLTEFIESSSDGLLTRVGEFGSNVSGGQRQRIGIARALLRKSDIIVFDESTNAIDAPTERLLIKSVLDFAKDKTVIWISHNEGINDRFNRIVRIEGSNFHE